MRRAKIAAWIGIISTLAAGLGVLLWTQQRAVGRSETRPIQKANGQQSGLQPRQTVGAPDSDLDQSEPRGSDDALTRNLAPIRTISTSLPSPPLPSRVMPGPNSSTKTLPPSATEEVRFPPRAPSKTLPGPAPNDDASEPSL